MREGSWHDVTLGRRSFEEWAEQWLADAVTPTKKPSTLAHYRSLLDCHLLPEFGRVAVAGILPSAVQSWVARLSAQGLAASSVRGAHGVLSQILERAVRDGAIPRNPAYRLSGHPPVGRTHTGPSPRSRLSSVGAQDRALN